MKTPAKAHKPRFLYDVVHADGKVLWRAVSLQAARQMVKVWNDIVPVPEVHVRKAWRVVPIDGKVVP